MGASSSNWFIDAPVAVMPFDAYTARFFQMHLYLQDKNGNKIPGHDAYYGWAFLILGSSVQEPDVRWKVWGGEVGKPQQDPTERMEYDVVYRELLDS